MGYVPGCLCGHCRRIDEAEDRAKLKRDHDTMHDTLTLTQKRCTELLEEARLLRAPRDALQQRVFQWARDTFGEHNATPEQRAMRLLEEVAELVQSAGVTEVEAHGVVDYVFAKPIGHTGQEIGGVGVTLLAFCESVGLSATACETTEAQRVFATDPERFRERHNRKAQAGIAIPT